MLFVSVSLLGRLPRPIGGFECWLRWLVLCQGFLAAVVLQTSTRTQHASWLAFGTSSLRCFLRMFLMISERQAQQFCASSKHTPPRLGLVVAVAVVHVSLPPPTSKADGCVCALY